MTKTEFNILNNHIGYGNPNAEIVFMGLEEGSKAHNIRVNYTYRYTNTTPLPSLSAFHLASPIPDMSDWFTLPKTQSTWGWYSKFMIHYLGLAISPLDYQLLHLGQSDDKTALLEFYPLPRPSHSYWDATLNVPTLWTDIPTYKAYCSNVANASTLYRWNSLKRIVLENKKSQVVIIHGSINKNQGLYQVKNEYHVVLALFGLIGIIPVPHVLDTLGDGRNVIALEYKIQGKKIFFTHFFGQGAMTNTGINNLATLI